MPWKRTEPMNEKLKFITAYLEKEYDTFTSLCERFSISRKTGYKYLHRYETENVDGLKERSRAPHQHGMRMPCEIESSLLEVKNRYPNWGAKKVLNWLKQTYPENAWPAKSTIDELFKRQGLVRPAKRKRRVAPYRDPFILCTQPNDVWSMDYKGQFRVGNGQLCYPLTITDNYSRFILAIDAANRISTQQVHKQLERLFYAFGKPLAIRSDNGSPFAGHGLGGLSRLNVWLIKNGVLPERIRAGKPQENGRHERMHFTLKQETTKPPKHTLQKQQQCFDVFRKTFNEQRPHEAINFNRPAWLYVASQNIYTSKPQMIEYDSNYSHKRKIRHNGTMKWHTQEIFVSETLHRETIAMKPYSEHEWVVYFSFMPIGIFNEKTLKICKI